MVLELPQKVRLKSYVLQGKHVEPGEAVLQLHVRQGAHNSISDFFGPKLFPSNK